MLRFDEIASAITGPLSWCRHKMSATRCLNLWSYGRIFLTLCWTTSCWTSTTSRSAVNSKWNCKSSVRETTEGNLMLTGLSTHYSILVFVRARRLCVKILTSARVTLNQNSPSLEHKNTTYVIVWAVKRNCWRYPSRSQSVPVSSMSP